MTTEDPKYKHKPSEKHTLEEVLKSLQDLIRNDLLDGVQTTAAAEEPGPPAAAGEKPPREHTALVREDFAPVNPAAGPVNLDAVMRSLKDLVSNELNVGDEPAAAEESSPSLTETEDRDALENLADEFAPLDEDLTFEESMEMVPPPLTAPTMPELPGEISAEMLSEPEAAPSPPAPKPAIEENIVPGTQHQLLFEEAPPPAVEPEPSTPDLAPEPELEPEPAADDIAPEMTHETAAENLPDVSGDALPTIDVEETFDENTYFEAQAQLAASQPAETREIREIISPAIEAPLETETTPPANGEAQTPAENPAPTLESASGKPKIKLEIADEPATESLQYVPSVDFDAVEFELPHEEPPPPSQTIETPVPADESSPVATDATFARELTPEPGPGAMPPPSAETKPGATPETEGVRQGCRVHGPEDGKVPDTDTALPVTADESHASAPATEPTATEKPEAFNLDDIPVLHEVVASPADSAPAGEPASPSMEPPLPAPNRARDIVVRAVAKLNVEMRKHGGAGLDTKTILRLQQLIRRELEKDGEKS